MSITRIRGIIINENVYGEADKYITIFAKGIGKISVFAKGAGNTKSKFLASTAIFTYADFIIRTASKTPTLVSVDIIESFYKLTSNIEKYYFGNYILEFVLKIIPMEAEDDKSLFLLLKTLNHLKNTDKADMLTIRIFEIKMLKYLGYNPYNQYCAKCGSQNPDMFTLNGLECHGCSTLKLSRKLLPTTIYTLKYISESNVNDIFKFSVNDDVLNELGFITEQYIKYHIDVKLKSYSFIKRLHNE